MSEKFKLFEKVKLGSTELKNRMVMAPMTRSRALPNGVNGEHTALYYAQRASAGLIITEATAVSKHGSGYPVIPGIYNDEQEGSWRTIIDGVHAKGGKIYVQLFHTGRAGHSSLYGAQPMAPSVMTPNGKVMAADFSMQPFETPREMTKIDIEQVIEEFTESAKRSIRAGADGVELHAAAGYVIDQFLRDGSNKRTDEYGGSAENRARFLDEIVSAVSKEIGAQRLAVRFTPYSNFNSMSDSNTQETFVTAAKIMKKYDLAFLHISEQQHTPTGPTRGPNDITQAITKAFGKKIMLNGGYDKKSAEQTLKSGEADAIAFGIPYIANPDLVERYKLDAPLNTADNKKFYTGGASGYVDYKNLGEEKGAKLLTES